MDRHRSRIDEIRAVRQGAADHLERLALSGVRLVAARPTGTPDASGPAPDLASKPLSKPSSELAGFGREESLDLFAQSAESSGPLTLEQIRTEIGDCKRCKLHEKRTHIVFGEGNPDAEILFIGEGPGEEEDRQARPFVGRSGKLLTKIIEGGMKLRRDEVFIANIVKCRPPSNREPEKNEIATCKPFLLKQIRAIKPKVIVTLGRPSTSSLLGRNIQITRIRGQWHDFYGIPLMPTYHPAFLLRQYTEKNRREVWEDMKSVLEKIREPA